MKHRIGRAAFTIVVGLLVATLAYRWITNPDGREERAVQVSVVESSRLLLKSAIANDAIEIVDPMRPNRRVGKVYVYPEDTGWSVSGFYRRADDDLWHPYLMMLSSDRQLKILKVQDRDPRLVERAGSDPLIEVSP